MRLVVGLGLVACTAGTAHAGGVSRPFNGSAVSSGMGGAFGAIADDASCLTANPAGCGFAAPGGLISLDIVYAPRVYRPSNPLPDEPTEQDAAAVAPAPTLGFLFKPGPESNVTFGVGAWNSYGGQIHWDKTGHPAVDASTELVFEVGIGAGWAVDEYISVGAVVRLGLGLFAVEATQMPADADLSSQGLGIGAGAGILVKATKQWHFGLNWKSNLDVTTTGSGVVENPDPMDIAVEHVQHWPQSVSLATAYHASPALTLAAQVDWVQWSSFEELVIHAPGNEALDTLLTFPLDWKDSITARLGAQYATGPKLTVRGGALFDSNSVPDRTIDRQYLDGPKFGLGAGASYVLSDRFILDLAASGVAGPTRTVPDNSADFGSWPEQLNDAPGEHAGQVFTLTTALRIVL